MEQESPPQRRRRRSSGPSGAAARFWDPLRADEHGAPYSDGSRRSPYAVQVLVDFPAVGAKADDPIAQAAGAGAGGESTRRGVGGGSLSAVLGVVAAITTGTVGPPVAFGSFLAMLGGVVAVMAAVRGP